MSAQTKRRYAIVGTGVRAIGMWGRPILRDYPDIVELVGLCDINPLRVEVAKRRWARRARPSPNFDEMLTKAKPDLLMVTTVDAFHSEYLVRAMERGIDVMTEKPMVIDETQCRAVLDAEKKTGRKIVVTHNYRYAPKHQKIKELLMGGEIGKITSVDFNWFLDTTPRRRLLPPLAPAAVEERIALGAQGVAPLRPRQLVDRRRAGAGVGARQPRELRQERPLPPHELPHCPHKDKCSYYWDINKRPEPRRALQRCESADGYQRDGCVFKEDIDIFDTMNAVVRYSNGVNMSYSVNTFMPVEGYYLAFNGTKGRLEVRDYERQAWDPGEETGMYVIKNFGKRVKIDVPRETEGHGGGDQRLRDLIFKKIDAPAHMRLPDSRAGAMSCLTGIAARKSIDEGRPIKIADLVRFA